MGRRARRKGLTRADAKRTTDSRVMDGQARHYRWLGRKVTVRAERGQAKYTFEPPLGQPLARGFRARIRGQQAVRVATLRATINQLPPLPRSMRPPLDQLMAMARDQQARDELRRMADQDDDDAAPDIDLEAV